jgi:hypothetical protein
MRTGWKFGIVIGIVALVGAGLIAGVALADAGKDQGAPAPAPAVSATGGTWRTAAALEALMTCADEQGLDSIVEDVMDGSVSFSDAAQALSALGACEDEARALATAIGSDVENSGDLLRGAVTDAAGCLDEKGVTLSSLASALLGGSSESATRSLQDAAEACLPDLSSLTG